MAILKDETINALKAMIRDAWGVNEDDILSTSRPGTAHEVHIYDANDEANDSRRLDFDDDFRFALIRPELVAGKPNLLEDIRNYILGQQGGRRRYRRKSRKSHRRRHRKTRRHH